VSTSVGSAGGTAGIVGGSLLILLEAGFGACALIAAITGQSAARVILTVLGAIQLLGALIDALKERTVAGVNPGIAISLFVIGLGLWWLPSTTEAMKAKQAQHRPH
jgi:hypothetical protein